MASRKSSRPHVLIQEGFALSADPTLSQFSSVSCKIQLQRVTDEGGGVAGHVNEENRLCSWMVLVFWLTRKKSPAHKLVQLEF